MLNGTTLQNKDKNNEVLGATRNNTNSAPLKGFNAKKSPPMLFDIVNCVVDGWNSFIKAKFDRVISTVLLPIMLFNAKQCVFQALATCRGQ